MFERNSAPCAPVAERDNDSGSLRSGNMACRLSALPLLRKISPKNSNSGTCVIPMDSHTLKKQKAKKWQNRRQRNQSISERYRHSKSPEHKHELLQAVEEGDLGKCIKMLTSGCDPNGEDESVDGPIHIAAKRGRIHVLGELIKHGVDINKCNKNGNSPLHLAVKHNHIQFCDTLLQHREIKPSVLNRSNESPLHFAAKEGHLEICVKLVNRLGTNSSINSTNKSGQTPVHLAAKEGHDVVLEFLLTRGGKWDVKDNSHHIPLHYVCQKGYDKCCDILIRTSSSPESHEKHVNWCLKDRTTPLMLAAKGGYSRCCELLTGADVNAKDSSGNTALHYAAGKGFVSTVEELLRLGAKLMVTNKQNDTPFHKAAGCKSKECLEQLLQLGSLPVSVNNEKCNVFHIAAEKNSLECLGLLLNIANVDLKSLIDQRDINGNTPLHLAVKKGNNDCGSLLLDSGAAPNIINNSGNTPLHSAVANDMRNICNKILKLTRDQVSLGNKDQATPLHFAAHRGSSECCSMLLKKGARISAVDKDGKTPLHKAAEFGRVSTVKFLIRQQGVVHDALDAHGNTPLHLAAAGNHLESCQLLAAAAPHVYWKTNKDGEYPINLAFKAKHDDIFTCMIQEMPYRNGMDNFILSLHANMDTAVKDNRIKVIDAIVTSNWWSAGFCGPSNHECDNFKALVKENPKQALIALNKCHSLDDKKIHFDFRFFEDMYYLPAYSGKMAKSPFDENGKLLPEAAERPSEHMLLTAIDSERLDILQHPVTNSWLQRKWNAYMRSFIITYFILEILSVVIFSVYVSFTWNWRQLNVTSDAVCSRILYSSFLNTSTSNDTDNDTLNDALLKINEGRTRRTILTFLTLCFSVLHLMIEINIAVKLKKAYFNMSSLFRVCRLIGMVIMVLPFSICEFNTCIKQVGQWQIGIVTLLVAWLYLIYIFNQIPVLSVFMPVTLTFVWSFLKVVFFIVMMNLIFGFVFHLLLSNQKAFATVPQAMVKSIVWMLGDLAYEDTFIHETIMYPIMVNIIFVVYVTTISGFIVNLIVTQPSQHLERFRERAALHKKASQIHYILMLDAFFPRKRLKNTVGFWDVEKKDEKCLADQIKAWFGNGSALSATTGTGDSSALAQEENMNALMKKYMQHIEDQNKVMTKKIEDLTLAVKNHKEFI